MPRNVIPIVTIQLCASFAVNILLVMLTGLIFKNQGNVSLLMILMTIPALVFSKAMGFIIDQDGSRNVLIVLVLILIAATAILLGGQFYNHVWILYGFAFCAYTLDLFVRLYLQVAVTDIISRQHYLKMNSLLNVIENVGIVLGPALGGICLQNNLTFYGFAAIGLFYVCTFVSALFIKAHRVAKSAESDGRPAATEAGRAAQAYMKNKMSAVYFAACLFAFAIGLVNVRQISFVITHYHTAEIGYSLTESMWGLGMILGCFTILFFGKKMKTHMLIGSNFLLLGVSAGILVLSHNYGFALALFLLLGIGNITVSIGFTTLVQRMADQTNMGKALGTKTLWQQISTIAAMGCAGILEARISSELIYSLAGGLLLIGGFFILSGWRGWSVQDASC